MSVRRAKRFGRSEVEEARRELYRAIYRRAAEEKAAAKPKTRHVESETQIECVKWFRRTYTPYARLLFSVPNGGYRTRRTAAIMKAEGTVAGAPDLILLVPRGSHCALCIEMKTSKGRQSPQQKAWQKDAESVGALYVICRSEEDFRSIIDRYMQLPKNNEHR